MDGGAGWHKGRVPPNSVKFHHFTLLAAASNSDSSRDPQSEPVQERKRSGREPGPFDRSSCLKRSPPAQFRSANFGRTEYTLSSRVEGSPSGPAE
jgi:hypothetical protein